MWSRPASTHMRPANFFMSLRVLTRRGLALGPSKLVFFFFLVGTMCSFPYREGRLCLGFNFSSALPRCWGFSLGLTRESLRYHFRLMVRRIWPWAQPLQPSQPIIFALPPAPVSIASLASGGRFDMLMPSGAPGFSRDHINVVLSDCGFGGMNIHITFFKRKSLKKRGSYLGGVVCVFNHPAILFFQFSSVTAAAQIKLICQARSPATTARGRASLSLSPCQDICGLFFWEL